MFCNEAEKAWLLSLPKPQQQESAALIFSAKECFYKLQYPLTKQWLGFQDAAIRVNLDKKSFKVTLLKKASPLFPKSFTLSGRFLFHGERIFTGLALAPSAAN